MNESNAKAELDSWECYQLLLCVHETLYTSMCAQCYLYCITTVMIVVTSNVSLYHNAHKTKLGTHQGVEPIESVSSMEVIKDSIYDHWDIGF